MTAYYHTEIEGRSRLQEITVGEVIEVLGVCRRVISVTIEPATEADPEMGVELGDPITTVEFAPPEAEAIG